MEDSKKEVIELLIQNLSNLIIIEEKLETVGMKDNKVSFNIKDNIYQTMRTLVSIYKT